MGPWDEVKETGEQAIAAWKDSDFVKCSESYTEDCVCLYPKMGKCSGRLELVKGLEAFFADSPELPADFTRECSEECDKCVVEIQSFSYNGKPGGSLLLWKKIGDKWQIKHEVISMK